MSNQLATQQSTGLRPASQFDLSPQTFEQALEFSKYLANSEMVPKQYRNKPGDCLIAMQWGFELGLKPLQALQSISAINGKPNIYGDVGKAILIAAGCIIEEDDTEVIKRTGRGRCKITRPGRPPCERTFSIEDAKTANLWGKEGPWRLYPQRQMAWRAFWFAARDCAADLLRGMSGVEETQDMAAAGPPPAEKHMGQAEVVLPEWPADRWAAGLGKWVDGIAAGKPIADVLAWLNSKARVTPEQEKQLRAEVEKRTQPEQTASQDLPDVDPDKLIAEINAATTMDAVYERGGLIEAIADPAARQRVTEVFDARVAELEKK